MERDINVVVRIKEDGTMSFVSGDGLQLRIGGGGERKMYSHFVSCGNYDDLRFFFISSDNTQITAQNAVEKLKGKILHFEPYQFNINDESMQMITAYVGNDGMVRAYAINSSDSPADIYFDIEVLISAESPNSDTVTEL